MTTRGNSSEDRQSTPVGRVRLVPPRLGEVERHASKDRDAQRFFQGLRGDKRQRLALLLGNALVVLFLVGGPLLRGHLRARDAQRGYLRFAQCIYAAPLTGGLGELAGEAEYFAAQLARAEPGWLSRCAGHLDAVVSAPALFVLPGSKAAEARVREAVTMLRGELSGLAAFVPGARMPERALRALRLVRGTLRMQLQQAGFSDREAELPLRAEHAPALPAPARLPLYAAPDAALTVWGDDHTLHLVGIDANGLAYLEVLPGAPFSRARLVRPRSLRGYLRSEEQGLLVWATPPARCSGVAASCFGKTTRIAPVEGALLELPAWRSLAAHLVGRPDRGVAVGDETLTLAALHEQGHTAIMEFALPRGFGVGSELPPLAPLRSWPLRARDAVLLERTGETFALAVESDAAALRLVRASADAAQPVAELPSGPAAWVVGCTDQARTGFAFGNGQALVLGTLERDATGQVVHSWQPLDLTAQHALDPEHPSRDRVLRVCTAQGALLLARPESSRELLAFVCRRGEPCCQRLPVATDVRYMAAIPSATGALLAYAGEDAAQVRVRSLDMLHARLSSERVPAACWGRGGLCSRPVLARLGQRIVLLAPDKTDLLALESADEGQTWRALPAL
jgi:hypothetical protein